MEEAGSEITQTETIINPNKCNTLTYHFREIAEKFSITTKLEDLEPLLLLPLPLPNVTHDWLLCNECAIRDYLPCDIYQTQIP